VEVFHDRAEFIRLGIPEDLLGLKKMLSDGAM
jgi:hypothetical protein